MPPPRSSSRIRAKEAAASEAPAAQESTATEAAAQKKPAAKKSTATETAAQKKPAKLCDHGRRRDRCKECGGSGFCQHDRRRTRQGGGMVGRSIGSGRGKEVGGGSGQRDSSWLDGRVNSQVRWEGRADRVEGWLVG